jgi:hypothetical protein
MRRVIENNADRPARDRRLVGVGPVFWIAERSGQILKGVYCR